MACTRESKIRPVKIAMKSAGLKEFYLTNQQDAFICIEHKRVRC